MPFFCERTDAERPSPVQVNRISMNSYITISNAKIYKKNEKNKKSDDYFQKKRGITLA